MNGAGDRGANRAPARIGTAGFPAAGAARAAASAVAAYLQALAEMQRVLASGTGAGFDQQAAALAQADAALLDSLLPLFARAEAAEPYAAGAAQGALAALIAAVRTETQAAGGLYIELALWDTDPSPQAAAIPLQQLAFVRAAAQAAGRAALAAAPALRATIPGSLSVSGFGNPAQLSPGSVVILTFTVTNVGDAPTTPSTAVLTPVDTSLTLLSESSQSLGALAPGQAVELSWQVQATSDAPIVTGYDLEILTRDGRGIDFPDSLVVYAAAAQAMERLPAHWAKVRCLMGDGDRTFRWPSRPAVCFRSARDDLERFVVRQRVDRGDPPRFRRHLRPDALGLPAPPLAPTRGPPARRRLTVSPRDDRPWPPQLLASS
jgi:hypothetical protein